MRFQLTSIAMTVREYSVVPPLLHAGEIGLLVVLIPFALLERTFQLPAAITTTTPLLNAFLITASYFVLYLNWL